MITLVFMIEGTRRETRELLHGWPGERLPLTWQNLFSSCDGKEKRETAEDCTALPRLAATNKKKLPR